MYSGSQPLSDLSDTSSAETYGFVNETDILASLADSLDFSILLLDGQGRLIFSNIDSKNSEPLPTGLAWSVNGRIEFVDRHLYAMFQSQFGRHQSTCRTQGKPSSAASARIEIDNRFYEFRRVTPRKRSFVPDGTLCLLSVSQDTGWRASIEHELKCYYKLTVAELQVCRHLYNCEPTKAIANKRCTSAHTVKSQLQSVLRKTDSRNRTELTVRLHRLSVNLLRSGVNC